jgi:hypothetical protein
LALTRLGALETVPLAKHWLQHTSRVEQRDAAVEILLQAQDAKAASAWQELYTRDRKLALQLALAYPLPALAEAVENVFSKDNEPQLLTVLGHAGGPHALRVLEGALTSKFASAAAYGLARCPDVEATAALERALHSSKPAVRRWAARAAVVRSVLLEQSADGLAETLQALRSGSVRDDIFVGVWGSAVLDGAYATAQLRSRSLLVLSAAVASAGVQGRDFFVSAAQQLASEEEAARRELLSVAVLDSRARDLVPSHVLSEWVSSASPLASLGVRALAERDDPRFPERSRAWLGAPASLLRAATALGYARHRDPAKSSELSDAFAFETDAEVRLAIVTALSHRDVPKENVLRWASDLDPDPRVRAAARLAKRGQKLSLSPLGSEVAWLELPAAIPFVVAVAPGGFALPVPGAGQPVVPVLGVKSAALHVRLAEPAAGSNDAARSGEHRDPPSKKVEPRGGNAQR